MFKCSICGNEFEDEQMSHSYLNICEACVKASGKRALINPRNDDWKKLAEMNDLSLFERQPAEIDSEWRLWCAFSAMYPDATPNLRIAAETVGMSYSYAKRISAKWEYRVRILEYKQFIDSQTRLQRADAVRKANKEHLSMAETLRTKLQTAIDNIDPLALAPKDINSLMKTATDLERKALIDKDIIEQVDYAPQIVSGNNEEKSSQVDKSSLGEVLGILKSSGLLDKVGKQVGIEQTTRVIMKGDDLDE